MHTDAAETGSFESSSEIMNRTHRAVVDTLLNNLHGIPTDTPMFEKNGWTGDAAIGAEMFMLNLDVHELFAKWMRDVHETRDAEGRPLVIAPSSGDWGEWGIAPPWHSAYVMIPQWLYQYGGDRRVLTELYDGMKRYVDLEFDRSTGGIVTNARLGDWVSPEASPAGGNAPEDLRVSATAYLYAMLSSMRRSAALLGRSADAAHFAGRAATVKTAFNDAFLDREAGRYRGSGDRGYRQTHNVLALAFGLAPDAETAQRVADGIAADVAREGHEAEHRRPRDEVPAAGPHRARPRGRRLRAGDPDRLPELGLHARERRHDDVGALGARGPVARPLLPRHRRRLVLPARRRHPGVRRRRATAS